jgi:hypothetical protein
MPLVGMKECGFGVHFVRLDPGVESTVCVQAPSITCDLSSILFFGRLTLYSTGSHLQSAFPCFAHSVLPCPFFHASVITPARQSTTTSSNPNGSTFSAAPQFSNTSTHPFNTSLPRPDWLPQTNPTHLSHGPLGIQISTSLRRN